MNIYTEKEIPFMLRNKLNEIKSNVNDEYAETIDMCMRYIPSRNDVYFHFKIDHDWTVIIDDEVEIKIPMDCWISFDDDSSVAGQVISQLMNELNKPFLTKDDFDFKTNFDTAEMLNQVVNEADYSRENGVYTIFEDLITNIIRYGFIAQCCTKQKNFKSSLNNVLAKLNSLK